MVENKVDLIYEEDNKNTLSEFKNFAFENGFDEAFRTSAKTGFNVNESMEYLIDNIIERMSKFKVWKKQTLIENNIIENYININIDINNNENNSNENDNKNNNWEKVLNKYINI